MDSRQIARRARAALLILSSVIIAATSVLPLAEPAHAATTYTWAGKGDAHSWGQEKNWHPDSGTPQDGDSVVIDGTWTVLGVPTISLESLTVSGGITNGPTLVGPGNTITTKLLNWTQGTIAASIVVSNVGQMLALGVESPRIPPTLSNAFSQPGAPPVTFTNQGSVAQNGMFGLASGGSGGARVVNDGRWLGGPGTIASSHCCNDPGTFENYGDVHVFGTLTVENARFRAQKHSTVSGAGTLDLAGGIPDLLGPWNLNGPDATLALTDVEAATLRGKTSIGTGAKVVQRGSSRLRGKGTFAGRGAFLWLGGTIYADLTLESKLKSVISGSDFHELSDGLSAGGPGILTVEGTITQEDKTEVRLNGKIVNGGTWRIPAGATAVVRAGGLSDPPKQFRNAGTIDVAKGGLLTLESLGYRNPPGKGVIQGGGTIQLTGGIHSLSNGGRIRERGTVLQLFDRADVTATGTLDLASGARIEAHERAAFRGTFTIDGTGRLDLISALVLADLTTGRDVDVFVRPTVAPDPLVLDATNGKGTLRTKGLVQVDDGDPFAFVGPARILNTGSWVLRKAVFEGAACCASPAVFVNQDGGLVIFKQSDGTSARFSSMRFRNEGKAQVQGTVEFFDLTPEQVDGEMVLTGHIANALPLRVFGGVLSGAGVIEGDLRNSGTVDPGDSSHLGTITVLGTYRQSRAGTLNVDVQGAESDQIKGAEALELAGTLQLARLGAGQVGPEDRALLKAIGTRTGRFTTVLGLGTLGSGWRIVYRPASVSLELP